MNCDKEGDVMKLIFAIIHDDDADNVTDALSTEGYSATKLCSSGGFLRAGNTTLLIGVEEDKVSKVIEIIGKNSKSRKQKVKAPPPANTAIGAAGGRMIEVVVGGATVFVTDVERFEKV